jgi:hypothetical protein
MEAGISSLRYSGDLAVKVIDRGNFSEQADRFFSDDQQIRYPTN